MVKLRNPFLMMGEMSKSPHRGAGVEKGEKFFFNAAGEINARTCVRAWARPRELGIKICDTELSAMATFAGLKVSDQPAGSACSPHVLQCIFQPLQYFSLTKPAATEFLLLFLDKRTGPLILILAANNPNRP